MFISVSSNRRIFLLFALLFIVSAGFNISRAAAPLESSLENILRGAPRDSTVTVLIIPSRSFDLSDLDSQLLRSGATRRLRHQRVVEALRLETSRSQAGLIQYLNAERSRGRVSSYRAYWIANVVAVTSRVDHVAALAGHAEVGQVLENRRMELLADKTKSGINPAVSATTTELAQTAKVFNWALRKINVRPLWQRGITGRGILVGNIDSGVDGNHPALAAKWRGANGATVTESWYDAVTGSTFPIDDLYSTHGTKTMGCMVGQSGADTVGVAPDAQWIAAKAFDNLGSTDNATVIQCMEWMADPDLDPATVDDVPDILNLSLADQVLNGECRTAYWDALDNLKLLGVTPIIASGNKSPHGPKVSSPGNSSHFFAVTHVDSLNQYDANSSVPGPGYCDPKLIKPDLVAPGKQILSTKGTKYTSDLYAYDSGSSFATPIVSGVAALVRQANPELTPDQVYEKLRSSATDLGVAGADTLFGYGAVNADSAVALAGSPTRPWLAITKIELAAGTDNLVSPGEDIGVVLTLFNNGTAASAVSASVTSNKNDVTVTGGAVNLGAVTHGGTMRNNSSPFALKFSQSIPLTEIRTFNVNLTIGQYTQKLAFAVGVGGEPVPVVESYATHDINRVGLSITNYGTIGTNGRNGGGLIYPRASTLNPDHLYQGGLLIGTGLNTISDASYLDQSKAGDSSQFFNREFAALSGGNLEFRQPGDYAVQELTAVYADSKAPLPLGVTVHQKSYGWTGETDDDFIIVEYALSGPADSTLKGVYVAQHLDLDVNQTEDNDLVAYESQTRMLYTFDSQGPSFIGTVLLTQGVGGFGIFEYSRDIDDGFSVQEKWGAMTDFPRADTLTTAEGDYSQLLSAGPVYLKSGNSVSVAFAVVGGEGLDGLRANAAAARAKWAEVAAARGLDAAPPVVTVTPLRNQAPQMLNYRLDLTARDSASTVEDVSVIWRDIQPAVSAWSAKKASASSVNGDYAAILPGRIEGTRVQYFVRAIDTQGNQGIQPAGAPQELYTFYVGDTTRPKILSSSTTLLGSEGIRVSATVTDLDLATVKIILLPEAGSQDTLLLEPAGGDVFSVVVGGLEPDVEVAYYLEAADTLGNYERYPVAAPVELLTLVYVPVLAGDGDLNGKIDIFDLLAMLPMITGRKTPTAYELTAMDLDHNGKVDIFDLLELLKLLKR